jgi:hypothetical protein
VDGSALHLSPFDLWDYFAISSPGIPEKAGFDEPQSQRAVEMFSALADELFQGK